MLEFDYLQYLEETYGLQWQSSYCTIYRLCSMWCRLTWSALSAILSCLRSCTVGCINRYRKCCGIPFYRFPEDAEWRAHWVSGMGRKNWMPNEHSCICSTHFISGETSNDPLSPDYVPSVLTHTKSLLKRKQSRDFDHTHSLTSM